jgi:hypothetical protein
MENEISGEPQDTFTVCFFCVALGALMVLESKFLERFGFVA